MTDDLVNNPPHYKYNSKGVECIEAIEAALTPEEYRGYLRGQVMKYSWRCNYKGKRLEDLQKARWYLNRYIELTVRLILAHKSNKQIKKRGTSKCRTFNFKRPEIK